MKDHSALVKHQQQGGPSSSETYNGGAVFVSLRFGMGIDFHLISNFGALALITLAGPAVIFILFYRRGAL